MAKKDKKDEVDRDQEFARHTPKDIYDQGEARQVGGTVMNATLNRDEYSVDRDRMNDRRGGDDAPELHNYNELDPDNPAYVEDDEDDDDDDRELSGQARDLKEAGSTKK